MKKITVIVGPTSSGKTFLTVNLCKRYGGEIISADSRQIYKHMDIGTGKIPVNTKLDIKKIDEVWSLDGVNIWGYDLIEPDRYYSAYDYAFWALNKARDLIENGKKVFLVGGTGFYIDLFAKRVVPSGVKPNFKLRKKLKKLSLTQLQEKLTSLNLDMYKNIDKNNPVRLIRAIEIELNKNDSTPLPYLDDISFEYVGLTSENAYLYKKVDSWVEEIWYGGLIEETRRLINLGYENTRPLSGLVYKTVVEYIQGKKDESEATQRVKYDLHSYIRRQKTYFDRNSSINWFDISKKDFSKKISDAVQFKLDG